MPSLRKRLAYGVLSAIAAPAAGLLVTWLRGLPWYRIGQLLRHGPATPWQRRTVRRLSNGLQPGGVYAPWWGTYPDAQREISRLRNR
jgi:hypothetical protein